MYYGPMDIQLPIGDKVYILRYGYYIAIPEGKFVEVIDEARQVIFEWRTTPLATLSYIFDSNNQ